MDSPQLIPNDPPILPENDLESLDSGSLRRALELALEQISGFGRQIVHSPSSLSFSDMSSVSKIAQGISESTGLLTRLRTLNANDLRNGTASNCSAIVRLSVGWLTVGPHRCTIITPTSEKRFSRNSRKLRKILESSPRQAILIESQIGLDSLSEKHIGSQKTWSRLRALAALETREILSLIVYALVLGGLSLAVPVAVQVLVNTIALGSLLQPLVILAGLLLGVLVFSGIIRVIESYAVEVLQRRLFVRVAEDFSRRLASLSSAVHDRIDVRELANRFFEVVGLQKAIGRLLLDGLSLALQTFVGMMLLAFYHPVLLAFDVALLLGLGIVIALGYGAVSTSIEESNAKYEMAGWLETIGDNPSLFSRPQATLFAATKADSLVRTYLMARRRHFRKVLRQLIGGVGLRVAAMVALLGLGGWLVIERELTLGQLVAAELVVGVVASGFAKIGKHLEAGYDLLTSLDKVGKVLDLSERRIPPMTIHHPQEGLPPIGVELVELQTSRASKIVATVPRMLIPASSRVLLQGKTASGKSSVLEVLAGMRQPTSGMVRVFEPPSPARSETSPPHAKLNNEQSFLLRPDDVVAGSVFDNLRIGKLNLSTDEAWSLLTKVKLDHVIQNLEHQLDSRMLLNGSPLSHTEIARLCIARALATRPRLLLIDGALDHLGLDSEDRESLLKLVLGPNAPWTVVIVSSDPEVQEYCTQKFSLDTEVTS